MKQFLFLYLFLSNIAFSGNQILTYGPTGVELTGTLELQTFPGPPNFHSIKEDDEIERHFYLRLHHPINVLPKGKHPGVENVQEEKNVNILELAINGEDEILWNQFRKLGKGTHVKIKGTLFHRFTGHHHSRVLLEVKSIESINF